MSDYLRREDVLDLINAAGLEAMEVGDVAGEASLLALKIAMEALPLAPVPSPDDGMR